MNFLIRYFLLVFMIATGQAFCLDLGTFYVLYEGTPYSLVEYEVSDSRTNVTGWWKLEQIKYMYPRIDLGPEGYIFISGDRDHLSVFKRTKDGLRFLKEYPRAVMLAIDRNRNFIYANNGQKIFEIQADGQEPLKLKAESVLFDKQDNLAFDPTSKLGILGWTSTFSETGSFTLLRADGAGHFEEIKKFGPDPQFVNGIESLELSSKGFLYGYADWEDEVRVHLFDRHRLDIHPVSVYKEICGTVPSSHSNQYSSLNARNVELTPTHKHLVVLCLAFPRNRADTFGSFLTYYEISMTGELKNPRQLHIGDGVPKFRAFALQIQGRNRR